MERLIKKALLSFVLVLLVLTGGHASAQSDAHPDALDAGAPDESAGVPENGAPDAQPTPPPSPTPAAIPHFTHAVEVNAVMLNDAGWTRDEVLDAISQAADIFQKCGIRVTLGNFVAIDSPVGKPDLDGPNGNDVFAVATKAPPQKKPALYFFRSFQDGKNTAYSYPKAIFVNPDKAAPISDTSWIAKTAHVIYPLTYSAQHNLKPPYSSEAHELAHLFLGGPEHVRDGSHNLLAGSVELLSGEVTHEQCAEFNQSPLLHAP